MNLTPVAVALGVAGYRITALQHRATHMSPRTFWQVRMHTGFGMPWRFA